MKKILLITNLLLFGWYFFGFSSTETAAQGTCWPSNGGNAVMVSSCEYRGNGCYANGTYDEYCDCSGSGSCTCLVGPGTGCTEVSSGDPFYECDGGSQHGGPCTTDSIYGDCPGGSCVAKTSGIGTCQPNSSYSTISCWYADTVTPTPPPTPTATPTGGGGGGGNPTPTPYFSGNIYEDANAVAGGLGGTDNLCTGDISFLVNASGGTVNVSRPGESRSQVLSSSSFSITANTTNSDYTITLDLPFPPIDPDNPYQCACNADPIDPYRCIYTNQQPGSGLFNFYVKQGTAETAWFQTLGGSSWADRNIESIIPASTCTPPACSPALIATDAVGTTDSAGFPLSNTGSVVTSITGESYIHEASSRDDAVQAKALGVEVPLENYDFFLDKFGDQAQVLSTAAKPVVGSDLEVFFYTGDLTITENDGWNLTNTEKIIVFVDGNLIIDDSAAGENRITTVATGGDGFLMFIVNSDITVTTNVGYADILTNPATADITNVEGVFIADGVLTIAGADGVTDRKFIGAGTFVGWGGVDLQRNFDDGGNPQLNNNTAAEVFIFRPDFIVNAPRQVKSAQMTWREVEPSF